MRRAAALYFHVTDKHNACNETLMLAKHGQNSKRFLTPLVKSFFLTIVLAVTGCFPHKAPPVIPTATSVEMALAGAASIEFAHLSNADLSGFPAELASCPALHKLSLRGQRAAAPLPPAIGDFTRLTWLDLAEMELDSLPPEMGQLTNLEHLYLSDNSLADLPPSMAALRQLTYLNLDRNALTTLPGAVPRLTALKWLRLNYNQLADLPPDLADLASLQRLYLRQNRLTTLPAAVTALTDLQQLDLGENPLASLPDELTGMTGLVRLDLDRTLITRLPENIDALKNLQHLFLYGCSIMPDERERIRAALPDCEIAF